MRDAAIELTFHTLYGTPWMRRIGAGRHTRPQAHDVTKFPQVQEAIKKAKHGGYAEGIIRMLILLARARGAVRRDRLERSRQAPARPPAVQLDDARGSQRHDLRAVVDRRICRRRSRHEPGRNC